MNAVKHSRATRLGTALLSGAIFSVGLALAGMTQASKVIGFFDFSRGLESWDPSLGLVMAGGIAVYLPFYHWTKPRELSFLGEPIRLPTRSDFDVSLFVGSALFGVGWGLGGYCPGPAITSGGAGISQAWIVSASMIAGMLLVEWMRARAKT